MRYRTIDHTADFGIRVFGSDPKDLFANAAYALFDLLIDINSLKGEKTRSLTVFGKDRPDLMINWLREILFLWNGNGMLIKKAEIISLSETKLSATVFFDRYDPDRHDIKMEIKAVTYHQVQVTGKPSGWEAKVIFDI